MYKRTIEAIDAIISRINTHPDYSCRMKSHVFSAVRAEASKHSVSIEFPGRPGDTKITRIRRIDAMKNIGMASDYLKRNGISLGTLSALGHMVEPEGQPYSNFRTVQVLFAGFAPPPSEEVIYKVKDLVDILDSWDGHPVLRATEAHLRLVMIHPYEDGNGRSARLIQNLCLEQRGYPPALMHREEKKTYLKILGRALTDRYSGVSSMYEHSISEQRFHEYVASKVLDSVTKIEYELRNRNMYLIDFNSKVDRRVIYSVANRIRSYGRRDNREGISVHLKKEGKNSSLEISGDIKLDEVLKTLEGSAKLSKNSYYIKKV